MKAQYEGQVGRLEGLLRESETRCGLLETELRKAKTIYQSDDAKQARLRKNMQSLKMPRFCGVYLKGQMYAADRPALTDDTPLELCTCAAPDQRAAGGGQGAGVQAVGDGEGRAQGTGGAQGRRAGAKLGTPHICNS